MLWRQEPGVSQGGRHQRLGYQGGSRVAELQRVLVGHWNRNGHGKIGSWNCRLRRKQGRSLLERSKLMVTRHERLGLEYKQEEALLGLLSKSRVATQGSAHTDAIGMHSILSHCPRCLKKRGKKSPLNFSFGMIQARSSLPFPHNGILGGGGGREAQWSDNSKTGQFKLHLLGVPCFRDASTIQLQLELLTATF